MIYKSGSSKCPLQCDQASVFESSTWRNVLVTKLRNFRAERASLQCDYAYGLPWLFLTWAVITNVTSQSLKWACPYCDKACGSSVLHLTKNNVSQSSQMWVCSYVYSFLVNWHDACSNDGLSYTAVGKMERQMSRAFQVWPMQEN